MHKLKYVLAGSIAMLIAGNSAAAQDATANRINGVAEFLLDRAGDNFMYILQEDMKSNRMLKCYLPETYKYATSSSLQLLLQSGHKLWKESVEADLKNFGVQLILKEVDPGTARKWALDVNDKYIEVLQNVGVKLGGKEFRVDQLPIDASAELRVAVNSFYDDYLSASAKIRVLIADAEKARTPAVKDCPSSAYGSIGAVLKTFEEAMNELDRQMARFGKSDVVWHGAGPVGVSPGTAFYNTLMASLVVEDRLKYYKEQIDAIRREPSLVVQMFKLDQLIRGSIDSGENPLISASNLDEYNRFSRYALSFAILSEAQSTEQVKSVMKQLTLPPISFAAKREPGNDKFMITAYFGVLGGVEFATDSKRFGGLTVPVGFEYSYGLKKGALSLMLAPFDFAHPVNQIINDQQGSAEFKDIVNPGVYLSYGYRKLPLIIGVGYSRGRAITEDSQENRGRYFIFTGLDMPLFSFY